MNQVLKQALELSPASRYQLAMQLLASLEPVIEDVLSPEDLEELDRRAEALESGEDPGVTGKEFLARLRKRIT